MKNPSNIAADLNLRESVQRFERLVMSVLSFGEMDEWNGSKLRESSKGHGQRSVSITTVGKVTVPLRLPYVVQGSSKGIEGKLSHQWIQGSFQGYFILKRALSKSKPCPAFRWA
ncbi:MAG: hypothetical protein HC800_14075 [Phormidesmis sp. RL_2_1]|nr:hypothetical protein [Phormidesmis sp. RL_2_1]